MRYLVLLCSFISIIGWGQKAVFLHLNPKVNGIALQLNTNYTSLDGTVFKLDHFDYYISEILLTHDGGQTENSNEAIYLVEPENHTFLLGYFNLSSIEQLDFTVGVPKSLNTQLGSASQDISLYPESHPLSFQSPSMYWGWLTGYMHMIIGGFADSNGDNIPEAYFELHNLGNNNQQLVNLTITQTETSENQIDIYIDCNIEQWIKNIPIATVGVSHNEIGVNKTILDNVENEPVFTLNALANLSEFENSKIIVWSENHTLFINWAKLNIASKCILFDQSGKLIQQQTNLSSSNSIIFKNLNAGFYLVQILDENGNFVASKKTIIP